MTYKPLADKTNVEAILWSPALPANKLTSAQLNLYCSGSASGNAIRETTYFPMRSEMLLCRGLPRISINRRNDHKTSRPKDSVCHPVPKSPLLRSALFKQELSAHDPRQNILKHI